jgi:aminoacrylate hydrolase
MAVASPDAPSGIRVERKTLSIGNVELSYAVAGSGPAVLCIQGAGVIGNGWQPQVESLSPLFMMLTLDNRGIGNSSRGDRAVTIERMAADALAIADAERLDRFHLIGHSMGGLIAQEVALTARHRVKSLALLCTFADGARATSLSIRMLVLAMRSRIGTRAMRRIGMVRMIMPDAYIRQRSAADLAKELGDLFGRDLADQPQIISEQLGAMSKYSAAPRLPELSGIPTLVLSGSHDPIAPPLLGRDVASRIDGARFVEFSDASHALPIQCAREVNRLLLEHLMLSENNAAR